MNAALAWAVCVMFTELDVVNTHHLSTIDNARADLLSRGGSWSEALRLDTLLFGGSLPLDIPRLFFDSEAILRFCDPRRPTNTDQEFCTMITEAMAFFSSLTSSFARPASGLTQRL